MRLRFSIRSIMLVVVATALGIACLRYASDLIASLTLTATLLAMGVAVLGTAFSTGRTRAFCGGFAAFGVGYLALVFGPWASEAIRPHLATTKLLEYAGPRLVVEPDTSQELYVSLASTSGGTSVSRGLAFLTARQQPGGTTLALAIALTASESFLRVGHALFALLLGLMGGIIALIFDRRGHPPAAGDCL